MTVIYAIIGIPIMLITLRDLGNFLYKVMINAVQLMNFTSRKCRLFVNRRSQQSNTNVARLESGRLNTSKNNTEHESGNQDYADSIKEEEAKMVNYDDAILSDCDRPPRIPVFMAIGTTFGWIFLCAGVFKIWERDWTYAESCYFMFIRLPLLILSTIGLGDIAVRRRDLMIMCFVFVVIGLAMVSMCISVIQTALEDFFINFFLKLFLEYQSKLNQGNDMAGASIDLMQKWDNNKKAKYLMSFLSKERQTSVLGKVQKDAEACGIEVPPIFSTIDEESGIPVLLTKDVDEATIAVAVEEAVQKQVEAEQNTPTQAQIQQSLPKTVFYDTGIQTCHISLDDKAEQTLMITILDKAIVTDPLTNEMVEADVQCSNPVLAHRVIQTEVTEMKDSECMPVISEYMESDVQTEEARLVEQEIQTHLYDVLEALTQTETCVQKPLPVMVESEMQTLISGIRKTRMKKEQSQDIALRRQSAFSSVSSLTDLSEDEKATDEDVDSNTLDWNPIDGMHASKQRPVRDLKQFFEANEKRNSIRRSSLMQSSRSSSQRQHRSSRSSSRADSANFKS
ncbi:Ion channel [Onchocerca flexuosa]|uniref:Ion channel n=1 Tax=Onchocerca flexuosa TaxID=387005 RepID=A0A238BWX1_9BILA|nr:Ion channel [Onchocerca flexuosa]